MSAVSADAKQIQEWIEQRFCPVVLLQTTPDVEQSCLKNGLSFIDFLRPYERTQKEIYVRTTKEYDSFPLKNFNVRFRTLEELEHENTSVPQNNTPEPERRFYDFLGTMIREAADKIGPKDAVNIPDAKDLKSLPPSQQVIDKNKNYTPWFDLFREEVLLGIRASDHEAFDHPVGCLCVTSTANPDPVNSLRNMFNPDKLPETFTKHLIDPDVYKFYILVHDMQNGPNDIKVQNVIRKMNEVLGATYCRLIIINSRDPNGENSNLNASSPDIWSGALNRYDKYKKQIQKLKQQQENAVPLGHFMTAQDVQYIGFRVEELITQGIVPHMERKIRQINTTTVAQKKSVSNRLKSFFTAKKADEGKYSAQTPEIQIRKMADYCFMLHDYETALAMYKLIAGDFKNIKDATNSKFFAGTQEFSALCLLFTAPIASRKEIDASIETAYLSYKASKSKKFALRAALIDAIMSKQRGEYKRAAETFVKASTCDENNFFKAALLFEQAGYCYLLLNQFRKFAFLMILAGYRYSHSNQIKHSYRCYSAALKVYYNYDLTADEQRKWDQIFEHMSITMGRLSNYMNDLKSSMVYMHDFLRNCNQLPDNQKAYMNEFLTTVKHYLSTSPVDSEFNFVDLPGIDSGSFRVLVAEYGSALTRYDELPTGTWKQLEEGLVKTVRGKMHMFKWDSPATKSRVETWVANEPIYVEIELKNPLFIPIEVNKISLIATFTPLEQQQQQTPDTPQQQEEQEAAAVAVAEQDTSLAAIQVEPIDIVLRAAEKKTVQLKIVVTQPGSVHLQGLQWKLAGLLQGSKMFQLKGRRLNDTKQQRCGLIYEEDKRNRLRIIKKMPLLKTEIQGLDQRMCVGEVLKCTLSIQNVGSMALKNLHMKTSHPQMITLSASHEEATKFPKSYKIENQLMYTATPNDRFDTDLSYFKFDLEKALEPGESLQYTVFVRGSSAGQVPLRLIFYFEPSVEQITKEYMPFRVHRHESNITVVDALTVSTFTQTSYSSPDEYVLGAQLKNNYDKGITLQQLTCVSPRWTLAPLNFKMGEKFAEIEKHSVNMFSIPPFESTTIYFAIKKADLPEQVAAKQEEQPASVATPATPLSSSLPPPPKKKKLVKPQLAFTNFLLKSKKPLSKIANIAGYPYLDMLFRDAASSQESLDCIEELKQKQYDELVALQQLYPAAAQSALIQQLNIQSPSLEGRVFPFLEEHSMSLLVSWKTTAKDAETLAFRQGVATCLRVKFAPAVRNPSCDIHNYALALTSRENLKCPLKVAVHYAAEVEHDFASNSFCTVPVVFEITNFSADVACDFTLELLTPVDEAAQIHYQTPLKAITVTPYFWCGQTRVKQTQVQPGAKLKLPVSACMCTSGVFNLNMFRLLWSLPGVENQTLLNFNTSQYLVTINASQAQ